MPVIRVRVERLSRLTGLDLGELEEALFRLKCETEVSDGGEYIEVEVNPDRPDMYIAEGIARAVKGIIGAEKGWEPIPLGDSGVRLVADRVPSRPIIAAAVVYGVDIDEEYLEELIQFQEKLHESVGRRRVKVAIGFHDLSKLPSREVRYTELGLDTVMRPLGYSGESMPFSQFLVSDEKGQLYGSISLDRDKSSHPFLVSGGEVIAAPPVINSEVTRVEPGTRDLFIDVTGTRPDAVAKTLDIIVSNLAERRGARVGKVSIEGPGAVWSRTPLLEEGSFELSVGDVERVLGVSYSVEEVSTHLERMRHRATPRDDRVVDVRVPPFRADVIGVIDLIEDVAISVGYEALGPRWPGKFHGGSLSWETRVYRGVRDLLVGLGFTETVQLILTSPRMVEIAGMKDYSVEVLNPVQQEYSVLRPTLLLTILLTLKENQHRKKPVRIFEAGQAVYLDGGTPKDDLRLALAVLSDEAGFEDVQAPLYSILDILGVDYSVDEARHPMMMEGRTAILKSGGEVLGLLGEVRPEVLEAVGIEYPVAAAEISLEVLSRWTSRT
ncbi:MAG: phenylalanine--tRNA ligase subunit beta [Aeropyrum sp.]|nr:phenylalanine--tRNA ligase subunit beta [Aeropyrum sp.]MCE4616534.1 phenylalanine--tRNA ligase subunit beta [Aeropyrum sp.]